MELSEKCRLRLLLEFLFIIDVTCFLTCSPYFAYLDIKYANEAARYGVRATGSPYTWIDIYDPRCPALLREKVQQLRRNRKLLFLYCLLPLIVISFFDQII